MVMLLWALLNFILLPVFAAYDNYFERKKLKKLKKIALEKKEKENQRKEEIRIRYESKIGHPHHDHMICVETGKIIEFFSDEIELIQDKIAEEKGYKIIKHIHQLFVKPIKK